MNKQILNQHSGKVKMMDGTAFLTFYFSQDFFICLDSKAPTHLLQTNWLIKIELLFLLPRGWVLVFLVWTVLSICCSKLYFK